VLFAIKPAFTRSHEQYSISWCITIMHFHKPFREQFTTVLHLFLPVYLVYADSSVNML